MPAMQELPLKNGNADEVFFLVITDFPTNTEIKLQIGTIVATEVIN